MKKGLVICSILIAGLAAACTLAPRDTGTAFMFALAPIRIINQGAASESLVVALPTTSPELDTYRIALTKDDGRWDYYAGARWAEFLPLIVQDSLMKTLEHARLFKSVRMDQTGLIGDKLLKVEIRAFQAAYAPGAATPVIGVRMAASLLSDLERTPLATFTVSAERKASGNRLSEIQAAFVAAFNEAQLQLVDKLGRISSINK